MNENWQEHYKQRKNRPVSPFLIKALPFVKNKNVAVDLGSGDLVDAKYLLSEGFEKVIAVDIARPLPEAFDDLPKTSFNFIQSAFDEFEFPIKEYDLVNAHYSLPFNNPRTFPQVWDGIKQSLAPDGIFTGQFLGINDAWNDQSRDMTFHTTAEVDQLLSGIEIIELQEEERDWIISSGVNKHWHVFHVIARAL